MRLGGWLGRPFAVQGCYTFALAKVFFRSRLCRTKRVFSHYLSLLRKDADNDSHTGALSPTKKKKQTVGSFDEMVKDSTSRKQVREQILARVEFDERCDRILEEKFPGSEEAS